MKVGLAKDAVLAREEEERIVESFRREVERRRPKWSMELAGGKAVSNRKAI